MDRGAAAVLVLASLATSLVGGCFDLNGGPCGRATAAALLPVVAATTPREPLAIELALCDPEDLYRGGSLLVMELRTFLQQPTRVEGAVELPAGVEVVSGGSLLIDQDLVGEDRLWRRSAVVRAEPGTHVLRAWANLPAYDGISGRVNPHDALEVSGDRLAAKVRHLEPTVPQGVQLTLDATAENPSIVNASFYAPFAWTGHAQLWTGAMFLDDPPEVTYDLAANETARISNRIILPEEWLAGTNERGGAYQVSLYVFNHPRDGGVFWEDLYFLAVDGEVQVVDELPREPMPSVTPPRACGNRGC